MSVNTALFSLPKLRLLAAGMTAVTLSLGFSACSSGISSVSTDSLTPLPSLNAEQQLRDDLARTEAAIVTRASEISTKATHCANCVQAASLVAQEAQARLDALGGTWKPWGDDVPQSAHVELPLPVADAPLTPQEFVQWMHQGAQFDLQALAQGAIAPESRPTVLLSALLRLRDSQRLASAYDLRIDEDSTAHEAGLGVHLPDAALDASYRRIRPAVASTPDHTAATERWASWSWSDAQRLTLAESQTSLDQGAVNTAAQEVSDAIQQWDCAAQQLPGLGVTDDLLDFANKAANELLTRNQQLLAMGVTDSRILRCHGNNPTIQRLARSVIQADLHLALSSNPNISWQGIKWLHEDLHQWNAYVSAEELNTLIEPLPDTKN